MLYVYSSTLANSERRRFSRQLERLVRTHLWELKTTAKANAQTKPPSRFNGMAAHHIYVKANEQS